MRPVIIAATRPNFVKVAPLLHEFSARDQPAYLVHTGQHYDAAMSDRFFADLDIREPDANLGIGSGTHAEQTAGVMVAFERWAEANSPDAVIVVGDVNSTAACAMVAAKVGIPVAHLEAGLRSFDRTMPEEVNRVIVDCLSTWHLTPSADADVNLLAEGVDPSRIHLVGNIMVDSLLKNLDRARALDIAPAGEFGLVTLHRPALVDDPIRLAAMLAALRELSADLPLVFPVHPRTRERVAALGVDLGNIELRPPVGYLESICLQAAARLVLTDSGGLQEESTVLGTPCLTLRENTERPVTVTQGTNRLVGLDPHHVLAVARATLERREEPRRPPLWDGKTSARVLDVLSRGIPTVSWIPPYLDSTDVDLAGRRAS